MPDNISGTFTVTNQYGEEITKHLDGEEALRVTRIIKQSKWLVWWVDWALPVEIALWVMVYGGGWLATSPWDYALLALSCCVFPIGFLTHRWARKRLTTNIGILIGILHS